MDAINPTYTISTAGSVYSDSAHGKAAVAGKATVANSALSDAFYRTDVSSSVDQGVVTYGADGRLNGKGKADQTVSGKGVTADGQVEDPQVQQEIAQLRSTESKVKAHESAHKAVGGALTGAVSYTYTRGPDGKSYITGGEVDINMSSGNTPQETINRMQQVVRAALAPADPSPQDRAVAARANTIEQQARQALSSQQSGEASAAAGSETMAGSMWTGKDRQAKGQDGQKTAISVYG